jgi:hypothetical protein
MIPGFEAFPASSRISSVDQTTVAVVTLRLARFCYHQMSPQILEFTYEDFLESLPTAWGFVTSSPVEGEGLPTHQP